MTGNIIACIHHTRITKQLKAVKVSIRTIIHQSLGYCVTRNHSTNYNRSDSYRHDNTVGMVASS